MTDRTPADYAIEHGEYLAAGAQHLIDAINALHYAMEMEYPNGEIDAAKESLDDARGALVVHIYEFRKRRLRALATPAPAQPEGQEAVPVAWRVSVAGSWEMFSTWDEAQRERAEYEKECADDPDAVHQEPEPLYDHPSRSAGAAAPAQPAPLHVANERGEGEDAKDAARYRWLRDRLPWTLMSAHGYTRMAARLPVSIKADMDEAHEMDAALDAAMASGLSAIAQALAAAPKEKP
jgi:hypothetical protein